MSLEQETPKAHTCSHRDANRDVHIESLRPCSTYECYVVHAPVRCIWAVPRSKHVFPRSWPSPSVERTRSTRPHQWVRGPLGGPFKPLVGGPLKPHERQVHNGLGLVPYHFNCQPIESSAVLRFPAHDIPLNLCHLKAMETATDVDRPVKRARVDGPQKPVRQKLGELQKPTNQLNYLQAQLAASEALHAAYQAGQTGFASWAFATAEASLRP